MNKVAPVFTTLTMIGLSVAPVEKSAVQIRDADAFGRRIT